jgi:hypothetical protein
MKLAVKNLAILIGLSLPTVMFGQDPQLSQFYSNPIYTNPAFAGSATNARFVMSARSQYVGLNKNYRTGIASFDMNMAELNGGIGIIALTVMFLCGLVLKPITTNGFMISVNLNLETK